MPSWLTKHQREAIVGHGGTIPLINERLRTFLAHFIFAYLTDEKRA